MFKHKHRFFLTAFTILVLISSVNVKAALEDDLDLFLQEPVQQEDTVWVEITLEEEIVPADNAFRGVDNFEDFKTQMQNAAKRGGLSTIQISGSFDFPETIKLESTKSTNIVLSCDEGTVLGVEGFFRHFEITSSSPFILELKGATLDGGNQGGGIHYEGERLYLFSGSIINCVAYNGGGLSVDGNAVVEAMVFKNNTVMPESGNDKSNTGGAVYVENGELLLMADTLIAYNGSLDVEKGGGVYAAENCTLDVRSAVISHNEAHTGGGIALGDQAALSLWGNVEANKAIDAGGGVFMASSGNSQKPLLYVYGGKIAGNTAARGGGVFLSGLRAEVTGSVAISDNTAVDGGGIYACGDEADITLSAYVSITGNITENDGGGIWVDGLEKLSVLSPTVIFEKNKAKEGYFITDEADKTLHDYLIQTETFTQPYTYAYNNCDVVYVKTPTATVTFETNGGSDVAPQTVVAGAPVEIPENPAMENFVFGGWYKSVYMGSLWDFETDKVYEDTTLYAMWLFDPAFVPSPAFYTVNYHSNGGTGSFSEAAEKEEYRIRSLSDTGISRSGYSFNGWNTQANGEGVAYTAGQHVLLTEPLDLYAQWKKNTVGGGNGGGGSGGNGGNTGQDKDDKDDENNEEEEEDSFPVLTEEHRRYVVGYPDGSFRPDGSITRGEMASLFFNLIDAGDKQAVFTASFADVSEDAWYCRAVAYIEKHQIMTGYPDGTFGPNDFITRAELAAACANFFGLQTGEHPFSDVNDGHWANKFITNAYIKGWISGYPDGSFKPGQSVTRAETVTMMNKILNRKLHAAGIPEGVDGFTDLHADHWAYPDIIEAAHAHDYQWDENGFELWMDF